MLKFAVVFLATCHVVDTSMVTSIEKLRDFAAGSDASAIGEAIEEAIKAELEKVNDLTRYRLINHRH